MAFAPRPARLPRRPRAALLLAGAGFVLLLVAWLPAPVVRGDSWEERRVPGRCLCYQGQSTWAYLRAPFPGPEDESICGLERAGGDCRSKPPPEGQPLSCWSARDEASFWKRHAWAWGIRCSVCDATTTDCDALVPRDPTITAKLETRREAEAKTLSGELVVAWSPHYYAVTNLHKKLKLTTSKNTRRLMSSHEVAHLTLERGERARSDFLHLFGGTLVEDRPTAIYVVDSAREFDAIGARYFGGPGIHMNYAYAYNDRIADGFCGNGLVVSAQKEASDRNVHGYIRHQIGHIAFSCWLLANGFEDRCPRWAWCGAAHTLQKMRPLQDGYATYCVGEKGGANGPRDAWPHRLDLLLKKPLPPVESFFAKNSLSDLEWADHLRAWSLVETGLREDRDRWRALLGALREGRDETAAFRDVLGEAPEAYDARWRAFVKGDLAHLGAAGDEEGPPRADRIADQLKTHEDPTWIAGYVRGLERVTLPEQVPVLLPLLEHRSDLVREGIVLLLAKTEDEGCLGQLVVELQQNRRPLVRAGLARVLGKLALVDARFPLEQLLADRHPLVRANAAWALAAIADRASRAPLLAALDDKEPRAFLSIADALMRFPGRSADATKVLVARLGHRAWQVRLTAVRALGVLGTGEAVEPLIERLRTEDGRLKGDLLVALKRLTDHDEGPDAEAWARWWKAEVERLGGLPPPPAREPTPGDDRYAPPPPPEDEPHHYGHRFYSRRVAFVLDTSGSMELTMKVPAADAARLGGLPTEGTRMELAKAALRATIEALDPRTEMDLVFFDSAVREWKDRLVPASASNVRAALAELDRQRPDGETNFHGALKAALGLGDRPTLDAPLVDGPDTVWFVTDGRPTRGEITSMPELISWMEDVQRFTKVRLNVVAIGLLNVDLPQLALLAQAGKGELIHVPEE